MSASRINNILSGRFLSPRLVLCVLLGALCLLAFPRRSAQTSAGSPGSQQVASGGEGSPQNGNSAAARVASLGRRASITQLPVPGWNPGAPLSMASEDFDEDGVPDLVIGHAGPPHFSLSFYRGNEDAVSPGNPGARERRSLSKPNEPSALSPISSFSLVEAPDFLVTGDFNGDGHADVATAARGGDALYLMAGDGHGEFALIQRIELAGRVTALGSRGSEFGDIAVGIVDNSGPAVLLFRSLTDSHGARPIIVRSPDEVATIAFRRSTSRNSTDLLIAAGRELLVKSLDMTEGEAAKALPYHHSFSSAIRSIVIGSFAGGESSDVAVLTADGVVSLLSETSGDSNGNWGGESFSLGAWPGSTQLIRARISGSTRDDLVAIDPSTHRLHVLIEDSTSADPDARLLVPNRVSVSLGIEGEPLAVLPMRLNEDALSDLVILGNAAVSLAVVPTVALATMTVNDTADTNIRDSVLTLREAILLANGTLAFGSLTVAEQAQVIGIPGSSQEDKIIFNIPGVGSHTIAVTGALPAITDVVTIDGTSQPGFSGTPVIELNGVSAGAADGLAITASSCVVRGLVINSFSQNGIFVSGSGNTIERNFIGTNVAGSFALGNTQDGVSVSTGSGNTIGGTTSAARNVISGNRNGIQISGGSGTQVRGNFIGTNAAGTTGLGNSANGVLVNGSSGNAVGAVGTASSNTIAFNGGAGVAVAAGTGNPIQSNSIFSNGGLGIDLFPAGVTPNDTGDGDSGANNRQNFPVLTSASAAGTSTTIEGTLNSTASTLFRIEFFASQVSNPSGFGEGQTFIGAIPVTTDAAGNASFNPTFAVTVAPGQIITATATDPGNNSSEFSKSIQLGGVSGGTPADLSVLASIAPNPAETGSQVTKTIVVNNAGPATATSVTVTDVLSANISFVSCNSTGGGVCGGSGTTRTVTFASLAPGSTAVITIVASVNCTVSNGTIIGNTATVFSSTTPDSNPSNNVATATTIASNPAPRITCPANLTQINDSGRCTAMVNYFVPPAVDTNCPVFNIVCSPPSGSNFAIGTTTVTCVATDGGGATATCSFTVTVNDFERIAVACPASVSVAASAGQCSPVVNYSAPTVIDNCPGASVSCVPPSGSTFPLGVTGVVCTAVDAKGVQATCGFTVTVIGTPQAVVRLEGNGPSLNFGPVAAARKLKKLRKVPPRNFTVENIGCIDLVLTFDSLLRVGSDVDRGFISDPDDRNLFNLNLVDAEGNETPLDILSDVRIGPGQKQNFRIRFRPLIPAVAKGTRGLSADQALPDLITSVLTFTQNGGAPIKISLVGHLDTALILIDPENTRRQPLVVFSRVENEFIIEYSIYDSNLDIDKVIYQFVDSHNRPAGQPITVDLAALIRATGFVRGQSFTIAQRFTGAKDHPEIVGVEVTVSDSEASVSVVSASSSGTLGLQVLSERDFIGTTLFAPELALPEEKRPAH